MIDIVTKLFEDRGYEEKHSSDMKIFSLKEKYNYWVVISLDILNQIREDQIELFVKAKEIINQPQFDKNANLLVLNKVENLEDVNKDYLLQVEEDPFHFKKCIIYYTKDELAKLKEAIGDFAVTASIESMILREEIFSIHKQSFDANEYQSLLYRIAHKMPFIKINITQVDNISTLEEINKNAVGENTLHNLLESDIYTLSNDDFLKLSSEDILEKLKNILPNENQ
jgi:hypothetical protein